MSTNSTVAIQNEDGSVTGIYCHLDGNIGSVGAELIKTLSTAVIFIALIQLFLVYILRKKIEA